MKKHITILFFGILVLILSSSLTCNSADRDPCEGQATSIVILTSDRKIFTCQENQKLKEYRISLGRNGVDKRKQGDNKTPLGQYTLGVPRPSNKFGIFIPIGYPTQEQQLKGYSGSDVGVHGPYRPFKRLGPLNTWFNWTRGCVAVGGDSEISEIAEWIKERNVTKVTIK
jgi:murein L,D-transpeptidase YafK